MGSAQVGAIGRGPQARLARGAQRRLHARDGPSTGDTIDRDTEADHLTFAGGPAVGERRSETGGKWPSKEGSDVCPDGGAKGGCVARRIVGDYGIDAPYLPILSAVAGAGLLGYGLFAGGSPIVLVIAAILFAQAALSLYGAKGDKLTVWRELVDGLQLVGSERVLDIGSGRGPVLITLARELPGGRAVGVDAWTSRDHSGNGDAVILANAAANSVADRVALVCGDVPALPFPDDSFDVVTAGSVIQGLTDSMNRDRTIREMFRVTRPGGQILIVDMKYSDQCQKVLVGAGASQVECHGLGVRVILSRPFLVSRPLFLSRVVRAVKPMRPRRISPESKSRG